ncbi:mediator of RNA polymerase II transcription subunit 14, partial [Tremellales sp. Uapishka_1]
MSSALPQSSIASTSGSSVSNPQLGPTPYFAYPTPKEEDIRDELPPYWEEENVPLGGLLDRLTRRGYGDLKVLIEQTLPPLAVRQRPRPIIEFSKATRQAILKYLAVLRWKTSVDLPSSSTSPALATNPLVHSITNQWPTPHSNAESNGPSPPANGKGKGKAVAEDEMADEGHRRGKVTDAKRIQQFLEHQNRQHEEAVGHLKFVTKIVDGMRERNPDLRTAISLLSLGSYSGLPTSLTGSFLPKSPLTHSSLLATIRELNRHLLFRLRCVDFLPPELVVESVRDGRVYVRGGGKAGWRAELTLTGFGEQGRWWLVGVEWGWKAKDEADEGAKRFFGEERQQILDVANLEVLAPRTLKVEEKAVDGGEATPVSAVAAGKRKEVGLEKVDAPLVRVCNLLQHLSLSYQLETLYVQAMALTQGRWKGHLVVEMDRPNKVLRVKYWPRARPAALASQQQAAVGKRPPLVALGAPRSPMYGGILHIELRERNTRSSAQDAIISVGAEPSDRVLDLNLETRWEVGEIGAGGGLKVGELVDDSLVQVDPSGIDLEDILLVVTRTHASHLTRLTTSVLLSTSRVTLFPLNPPSLQESPSSSSFQPLSLHVPLPSQTRSSNLVISVSALTGWIQIDDLEGKGGEREKRADMASRNINELKGRLGDDIGRLMTAVSFGLIFRWMNDKLMKRLQIITEGLEDKMRELGWTPTRRLALRSQDLAKADLHPASTIFVPLPTSQSHYFVAKVTSLGVVFELLKLARIPADNGVGMKMSVGDRTPLDLSRVRERRVEGGKRRRDEAVVEKGALGAESNFEIAKKDLKDMFIFANALVAQTIVEQQLKDRSIPYTQQYPPSTGSGAPRSLSAVAGMIPTLSVDTKDLLQDPRATEVAMPKVFMQIRDWWKGGKCQVVTVVQLRHRPSLSSAGTSPNIEKAISNTKAKADGITFDQENSIVRFNAEDISRCVPGFLEQWERLSKVIVVAGDVNRLNKLAEFKDLKVLSFDLRTATLSYYPGFNVSITYTPLSDSYEVSFFRSSANTPATPARMMDGDPSPHHIIAPLLSHRLNELARAGRKGSLGRKFIQLLRDTLPFLSAVESIKSDGEEYPVLVIESVERYRLVWDMDTTRRYSLDLHLLPSGSQYLIQDGAARSSDLSCGVISPVPSFESVVSRTYNHIKEKERKAVLMKLDEGKSLVCKAGEVEETLRFMRTDIEKRLRG